MVGLVITLELEGQLVTGYIALWGGGGGGVWYI